MKEIPMRGRLFPRESGLNPKERKKRMYESKLANRELIRDTIVYYKPLYNDKTYTAYEVMITEKSKSIAGNMARQRFPVSYLRYLLLKIRGFKVFKIRVDTFTKWQMDSIRDKSYMWNFCLDYEKK